MHELAGQISLNTSGYSLPDRGPVRKAILDSWILEDRRLWGLYGKTKEPRHYEAWSRHIAAMGRAYHTGIVDGL
jgi:hypothetical protein